ncbi:MAG: CinA family protein [Dehalococcoidia bacterium]
MLEEEIAQILKERNLTISVAEACTSGLVSYRLTSVPGSSRYFVGGVLSYSNEVKEHILKIPKELMIKEGSVAEPTAIAMARGVRQLLGTDIGLSTTGVMGPEGGTPSKPVGLFFVAVVGPGDKVCRQQHHFQGERDANRVAASEAALKLLKSVLSE